jgi:hypothetical protein
MYPVCLDIPQIVEAIDGTGHHTERCEQHKRWNKILHLQQVIAEEYRCKDKDVL